jgi:hypothetical protein
VKIRISILAALLIVLGFCFFAVNRSDHVSSYTTAAVVISIAALTLSALFLAIDSLWSLSLIYLTRCIALPLAVLLVCVRPSGLITLSLVATLIVHAVLFSERVVSRCAQDVGLSNEDSFVLKSPVSIKLWFFAVWSIFWGLTAEIIHLFIQRHDIIAIIAMVLALVVFIFFIRPQMRILQRRMVIVPHGIVISDAISLTDVVLLPLSKIATVEVVSNVDVDTLATEEAFTPIVSLKNALAITLTEFTDSLIARRGVNETERVRVKKIFLSPADAKHFDNTFHSRFHESQPPELSDAQLKMVEKELGIETAPRSDAKLPQWRKKKTGESK